VENRHRLGINRKEYLTDVLTRLPGLLAKDAKTLTPFTPFTRLLGVFSGKRPVPNGTGLRLISSGFQRH
jgi:hypothetical protein